MSVAWLLHASDPHLGDVSPGQLLDDEKEVYEDQPDLETTQRVFKRTLRALARFVETNGRPDVVVVSGDLAYKADPSGFTAFVDLLRERSDILPADRSQIVVVPGNHDVVWEEAPGTLPRYERFLGATRGEGCSTPLLDGVDFDATTGALLPEAELHSHLVITDELLVVPLNSSNYCGMSTAPRGAMSLDAWEEALEPTGDARDGLIKELKRLRRHDIARISRSQIDALGRYFDGHGLPRDRSAGEERTRIAVLHHQLLPVSTREERKPFESLANLGLVRETLREYEFDLVLHGHKHESNMYWDLVAPAGGGVALPTRRILVISSPGHFDVNTPVMRAVQIEGSPAARNARVTTFEGAGPHRQHAANDGGQVVPLWSPDERAERETLVRGPTAHACYSRLRSLSSLRGGAELRNIVCRVEDPQDAQLLPPDYPDVAFDDPQAWFDSLVGWWQRDRSELVARGLIAFNHGERIRRRWGDQIERAVRILNERDESSRALVQLVTPRETGRYKDDERDLYRGSFPAFVLAELSVTKRDGDRFLDCFGYFRKQEMQYWWPVNLAELARLQDDVRRDIRPEAKTGRIVTFSAIAVWKDALPRVAVPLVDLLVEEPERLFGMAAALAFPDNAPGDAVTDWRQVLRDLSGTGRAGPPKVSAGLDILHANVERLAAASSSTELEAIVAALEDLRDEYAAHADREELTLAAGRNVAKRVGQLTEVVVQALPGAAPDGTGDADRDGA
jgi:3',5'-cyclic AMP phosphodiesterase CpdA